MSEKCAVIFDVDGVLVDSYQAHFESWREILAEHNFDFSESQFAETFGRTSREIIRLYWGDAISGEEVARIDDLKEARYRQIVATQNPVMSGASELIGALVADGFALALGSSGPPENVQVAIDLLQLEGKIGAAVTGRDVTRGKPDPQVFLLAAERLGVSPARCAVIEDAPPGIAAAKAANMVSIALVSTGRRREEFTTADHVVGHLHELTPLIIRSLIDRKVT